MAPGESRAVQLDGPGSSRLFCSLTMRWKPWVVAPSGLSALTGRGGSYRSPVSPPVDIARWPTPPKGAGGAAAGGSAEGSARPFTSRLYRRANRR